MNSVQSIKL